MAAHDSSPKSDSGPAEVSAPKPAKAKAKRRAAAKKERKRKSKRDSGFWGSMLHQGIEGVSLFVHGIPGLAEGIPENPVKAIVLVAILGIVILHIGDKKPETQQLCVYCFILLAITVIGLVAVVLKGSGRNTRLGEMQEERVRAVRVKPFRY
jgi:hypothetical protein